MTSEIVDAFQKIVRDTPRRPLIHVPAADTTLSALDLWHGATAVSDALDTAGVHPRGLIVAALGNRPAYLATFLACRRRDQPLCPLDGSTPPAEVAAIAAALGASAVVTPQATGALEDAAAITITRPTTDPGGSRHGEAAVLKMTSGSSGTPRATLTPERLLVIDSRTLMRGMQVAPDDVQIAAIPLSHAYAIGNLVVPLFIQGNALVMRDGFVPHRLPDDARRYGARVFPGVPFMFSHFVQHPPSGGWPPTLTHLISAGAALDVAVANKFREQFGVKVHTFYGTSETGGITFDGTDDPAVEGGVGSPLPGVELELLAEDGAPEGGGRVLVRGPAVTSSYADAIDPGSFVRGGFLTGDLGVIERHGALTLTGRVSSFVNVAGRKVQPDEVERVLREFEGVVDVRVLGLADDRRGEQLVACLVVDGTHPSVMQLRQHCGARLAAHKIPRAFLFVAAIPLTERGKTDRPRLARVAAAALEAQINML